MIVRIEDESMNIFPRLKKIKKKTKLKSYAKEKNNILI